MEYVHQNSVEDIPHGGEKLIGWVDSSLKQIGKDRKWLAERMGITVQAISKWRKSGKIDRDNFTRLVIALHGDIGGAAKTEVEGEDAELTLVPFYELGDFLGNLDDRGKKHGLGLKFRKDALESRGVASGSKWIAYAKDDAMRPSIMANDAVLFCLGFGIVDDTIQAVIMDSNASQEVVFRRLRILQDGTKVLLSDSGSEPLVHVVSPVLIIGRAVWRSGWMV